MVTLAEIIFLHSWPWTNLIYVQHSKIIIKNDQDQTTYNIGRRILVQEYLLQCHNIEMAAILDLLYYAMKSIPR